MTPVRYVGKREPHKDCIFGTGIIFMRDQSVFVPDDIAKRMLKEHPTVYEAGDEILSDTVEINAQPAVRKGEEPEIQDMRDVILTMDADALRNKAKNEYGVTFNSRMSVGKMRKELTQLVDRFGVI